MSPDSVSSLFPDRPIRPLPKRRLRERLSPDVADTIQYPQPPQNAPGLFKYPCDPSNESGKGGVDGLGMSGELPGELSQASGLRSKALIGDLKDDGSTYQARRALVSRPLRDTSSHAMHTPLRAPQHRHSNPQPPPSTASSADGYDSFENTNNKKKRKIPTAGESILNGVHVLNDAGNLGVPSPPTTGDEGSSDVLQATPSPYSYMGGPNATGQGISGPGRGRYGRSRNGRSPLRQLPDPNAQLSLKNPKSKAGIAYPPSPIAEKTGIITNAIASAEKLPVHPGQENISLLQQQAATTRASPASSQFTFTFDSQVPGTVAWPGSDSLPPHPASNTQSLPLPPGIPETSRDAYYTHSRAALAGQASQAPNLGPSGTPGGPGAASTGQDSGAKGVPVANAPSKKARRRGNPLLQAARQRRQQTEYQNYHHPPTLEDSWICEFCEYERIFGHPPEALIRQYEIKDRRRRREEAERRRLLEKAKMKSRKGKKASKLPAKSSTVAQDRNATPLADHQATHAGSEEYEEDDYYEDDPHDENSPSITPSQAHAPDPSAADEMDNVGGTHGGDGTGGQNHRIPVH